MNITPDDAWRRLSRPSRADVQKGGKNFQDLVGSYLCSVGHKILNTRTLDGCAPGGLSASALSVRLIEQYVLRFDTISNCPPHRAQFPTFGIFGSGMRSGYVLAAEPPGINRAFSSRRAGIDLVARHDLESRFCL